MKWIGGALGWALGGPIGGIIGFVFGSVFESVSTDISLENESGAGGNRSSSTGRSSRPQTGSGDFGISLLVLSAAVMKADNRLLRSELDYVKDFFTRQFGSEKAAQYILIFRETLKQDYNLMEVCRQIRFSMDSASRLQLLHYLFGLAQSDGKIDPTETETIRQIASYMGISAADFESIKAMFVKNASSAYKILEISEDASDEEVKKAYRKMAVKYHPDKVSHLGEEVQQEAKKKFQEVNAAYEAIKKERGIS